MYESISIFNLIEYVRCTVSSVQYPTVHIFNYLNLEQINDFFRFQNL